MNNLFSKFKSDLPASIVVFLVALPLCLGIALASGAPLFSGIIAGIIGGIIVALISDSPLGVSGPAAGLAVIVLNSIASLGSFQVFLLAVVLAGVIQILLGFAKAGVIAYYFPSSVIKGMLSGIGILIFFKQIPHAFGYDKDPEGDFAFKQIDGHNTFNELAFMMDNISLGAVIVTVVSLVILILWEQNFIKNLSFSKMLPGPLVAVTASILLKVFFEGTDLNISSEHLVNIPSAEDVGGFSGLITLPDFSAITNIDVYVIAITMAIVASLETLLCVEATDKLDPQKRITPTNKELFAQGFGNIISGLIGGLPITQVIVRSSANIQSGGKTKASAFLHGILLFVCVISIPNILNMIPLACLAAILLVVGYKLAKPALFVEAYKKGLVQFVPFTVTVLAIFFTNLLLGIGIGMGIAIFFILYNNFQIPFHIEKNGDNSTRLILAEDVSFLNKARILGILKDLEDKSKLIIDASRARTVHLDVIEILNDFGQNAERKEISIKYVPSPLEKVNTAFNIYNQK